MKGDRIVGGFGPSTNIDLALLRGFPLRDHLPQAGDAYPAGTAEAILLSISQQAECDGSR
ncbi:hypothetical protein [Acrocarpospora sp. B8E8]|uniref:hypothetical protein n=1 Tax=Acrocarpospora sp. B8E8 TaxID=3153572 RepID=UPI00325D40CD